MKFLLLSFLGGWLYSPNLHAQILGCTDVQATNYNVSATANDGSCVYAAASIVPTASVVLSDSLVETSGLVKWQGRLWTHNDNSDANIYALDTSSGKIVGKYDLPAVANVDWEAIGQDSGYLYVGDVGNNVNGNRKDLHVLRIEKHTLLTAAPIIDTIFYSYADQTDFGAKGANNTDFDCEALVVSKDSIYLFTKQWVGNKCAIYALSKTPGAHTAQLKGSYNVAGMITGATYLENEKLIALCGYSGLLQPFVYLLYDFTGTDFWGGNKRKLNVGLPMHQIEGIASSNGLDVYMTNEYFSKSVFTTVQKLHHFDMTDYLVKYLGKKLGIKTGQIKKNEFSIFPNPIIDVLHIVSEGYPTAYIVYDILGQTTLHGILAEKHSTVSLSSLPAGTYFMKISIGGEMNCRIEKL